MPAETQLRAVSGNDLLRVELDALTAIYDRRSCQTHLLGEPLPDILNALGDREWTLAAFADHLSLHFDLSAADDALAVLGERLGELAALGLVSVR